MYQESQAKSKLDSSIDRRYADVERPEESHASTPQPDSGNGSYGGQNQSYESSTQSQGGYGGQPSGYGGQSHSGSGGGAAQEYYKEASGGGSGGYSGSSPQPPRQQQYGQNLNTGNEVYNRPTSDGQTSSSADRPVALNTFFRSGSRPGGPGSRAALWQLSGHWHVCGRPAAC